HRERVRLLAGGAACRPDADAAVLPPLGDARDDLVRQVVPRLLVAEEARDVDQDRVEQRGELVLAFGEEALIVLEGLDPDGLHPPLESAAEAGPLVAGVVEAAVLADVL